MSITNLNEINVNDITFSEPKVNSMGGLSVYVALHGEKIVVQVPKCKCPFGLSCQSYDNAPEKYEVSISLNDSTEKAKMWREFISEFDERVKQEAVVNSKKWFKSAKEKSASVVEELYKPMLIESKNGDYPPTQKFKIPFKDNKCYATFFDDKKQQVQMDAIEKGCNVSLIAELQGLWFVGKQFGVTWRVVQAKVFPLLKLTAYAFKDEDDEDDGTSSVEEEMVEVEEEVEVEVEDDE